MGVSWRTETAMTGKAVVEYTQIGAPKNSTGGAQATDTRTYTIYGKTSGYYHHARMTALHPGAAYQYRVMCNENFTAWRNFTAPKASGGTSTKFVFVGDFGLGGAGPPAGEGYLTTSAFAAEAFGSAAEAAVDMIWVSGDIAYANMHGAADFEKTWNEWFDAMESACAHVPCMVSPGNHETYLPKVFGSGETAANTTGWVAAPSEFFEQDEVKEAQADGAWNFTAYDSRFKMPDAGSRNMWYSFDFGGVHFVSINTETDFPNAGEAFLGGWGDQMTWLRNDLQQFRQKSKDGWLVVLGHKPIYSAAPGYASNGVPIREFAHIQAAFEPLFHEFGVDLYLAGHQHSYERSAAIFNNKPAANGTVHIIAAIPGGGCGITADFKEPFPEWSVVRYPGNGSPWNDRKNGTEEAGDLGYGIVEANSTMLSFTLKLSKSGQVVDTVVIPRR
eukprot:CAMPEP_0197528848 /NCGR_PEP_ID=MMETSP1318-20131121/26538_1 /TAXON_ID=552666 /ORGANISM="Partenskyella glossopodia, Strain RCC365" /LENGTH=444 /DNA_ID=CAMNT_0043084111 /DNA_START=241 /DNA_END=1575 /DNA_ORIENTATION=-